MLNISADAWFSPQEDSTNGYGGGAELMIWLDSNGMSPSGQQIGTASIGGTTWEVWFAAPGGAQDWQYIAYRSAARLTAVNLDLKDFINDALSRGYLNQAWYLHSLEAGEEIISGGVGFAIDSFSFVPEIWSEPAGMLDATPNYGYSSPPLYDEPAADPPQTLTELDEAPGHLGVLFDTPAMVSGVRFYSYAQGWYTNHITAYRVMGLQGGNWVEVLPTRNASGPLPGWEQALFTEGRYEAIQVEYSSVSYGSAPRVGELQFLLRPVVNTGDVILTVNQTGTGSGTVGGGGTYPYNTQVTPTATAAVGSVFGGWTPSSCANPFALIADTTCTATFTAAPDFVVTGVVLTPASPIANGTFSAAVTVRNQGPVSGVPGSLQVWADQAAARNCAALGNRSATLPSLAAGASQTVTISGLPAGAVGAKTLRAFVDSACVTVESNEANNQTAMAYTVIPHWSQVGGTLDGTANYGYDLSALYDEPSADIPQTWTELNEAPGYMGVTFTRPTRVSGVRFYSYAEAMFWNHITAYRVMGLQGANWLELVPTRNATGPLPGWEEAPFTAGIYDAIKVEYSAVSYGYAPRVGELQFSLGPVTLTVNQAGSGSGTVGGGGTFPYNTLVTPTASAAAGSVFAGWTPSSCANPFALTADTTCTATFTAAVPDFVVTGVVLSPVSPVANGTFNAVVTVRNQGTAAGVPGTLQVWANQATAQNCAAVGDRSATLASLAAGASTTVTVTGLAAGAAGAKTLRAFIDSACVTTESNDANNQSTTAYTVVAPDFAVTGVTLTPASPLVNGTFSAVVTVRNQGTAAGVPGTLQVWANQATAQNCAAVGDRSATLASLAAGASTTVTVTGLAAGAAGAKTLRAFIDSACVTTESNDANNQSTTAYTVVAPDFAVTGVTLTPASPLVNGTFSAVVTVRNQGTAAGVPGTLQVWANQATAQNCAAVGDRSATLASLAAGASTTVTVTGLSAGAAGAKTLRAVVDSACATAEGDETNNQATLAYTVVAPDFAVTGIVVTPSGPSANGAFSAAVTVRNQGTRTGAAGTLQVWANQSVVPTCGAVGDRSATLASLAAGASQTVTVTGLSAGVTGAKTLRVFADSACATAEGDETNNHAVQAYTVFPRPIPDFVVTGMVLTPASPIANGTFSAAVTVKNQGSGSSDGGYLDVWASQPTGQPCGANGDRYVGVGAVVAGASKVITVTGIPAGAAGAKTLRAVVDSYCGTVESFDDNNQATMRYTVAP